MLPQGSTLQRKLVRIVLLISGAALLFACSTILTYEFLSFRQTTLQQASTLGQIIAANSTAAIAFDNSEDANEILSALKAEGLIVGAGLYDKEGSLFSHYPPNLSVTAFPAVPQTNGYRFVDSDLVGFQPVVQGNKRQGTLYLKWNMRAVYRRFQFYGASVVVIMTCCFLVAAYALSRTLRRQISEPVLALVETARAVSDNDYSVRATKIRQDEFGLLTDGFNHMLTRIEERTTEREEAESRLRTQLRRMELLDQIMRATAERQDLRSIFQVMIRSLEDSLFIDFGCGCLYEENANILTVTSVGVRSAALAMELALTDQARIPIDQNGLSHCVQGRLVYEPDIGDAVSPFLKRLASSGLRSFVAAPLTVEAKVLGVVITARYATNSFSSQDCEFIRNLSEHVALAGHQANLYGALQQAYDDIRRTQQTVMQQERLRVVGQMASGIAHDINNAISPAALYTESLLEHEPNLSDRAREHLITIKGAIEDVALTVARLREFYRDRELQLELTPVDLGRIVQQVIDLTRPRWKDQTQKVGIVVNISKELMSELPNLVGVENEIRDALINLVLNAVDAMPDGGTLILRTRTIKATDQENRLSSADVVHMEVSDTGVGMDEETRRRCLEPFFTTKGERGTGLGLAMVYGMVQRHKADIEIESKVGKGTTVRVIFPISAKESPSVVRMSAAMPLTGLRILIVDDEPLVLKALRDTLESDGHFVTTADGGEAGIHAFRTAGHGEPFAVVITDLGMPYVDGRKVAAAIKVLSASTPVILLTGWGQRLAVEQDIPSGIDRVLNKPPKVHDLRTALIELTAIDGQLSNPALT